MPRKKDKNSWIKNIESIFTTEELNDLVDKGKLEIVKVDRITHCIKAGCKRFFNPDDFKQGYGR